MIKISIQNETSRLREVVLGTAESLGETPTLETAYDPKSREHIQRGTFPKEADLKKEMDAFNEVFNKYDVKVYRPKVIENYNQVFSRDIGFVVDDIFVMANILPDREKEIEAIQHVIDQIPSDKILKLPAEAHVEGGDVMPWGDYIFVGTYLGKDYADYITARTNVRAVECLQEAFPNKIVRSFDLKKSNTEPHENALHLDCCFQPIGTDQAILYKGGFNNPADVEFLVEYFGEDNIIEITKEEMYQMNSNVFSISPTVIVSEQGFIRLNSELRNRNFTVEEIPYAETAKMEGLLRCSTLPLLRD